MWAWWCASFETSSQTRTAFRQWRRRAEPQDSSTKQQAHWTLAPSRSCDHAHGSRGKTDYWLSSSAFASVTPRPWFEKVESLDRGAGRPRLLIAASRFTVRRSRSSRGVRREDEASFANRSSTWSSTSPLFRGDRPSRSVMQHLLSGRRAL